MKQYKALFFDFDDTLFDFKKSEAIALKGTFEHYQIPLKQETFNIFEQANQNFWRAYEKGIYKNESDSAVRFEQLAKALGRTDIDAYEMCEYYIDLLSTTAFPIEDSVGMLERLSRHYAIYIVTNALKKVNDRRSEVGGILPFIKGRFISEQIGVSKPNPGFFDYCFAHIPYAKEEVLLIGDSLISDMRGGVQYGIDTCWYNPKGCPNTQALPVTHEIASLKQLEEILE